MPKSNPHILFLSNILSVRKACFFVLLFLSFFSRAANSQEVKKYFIDESSSYYINLETWEDAPNGGDTIFISSERTKPLRFQFIIGEQNNPVVVINYGGQVNIDGPNTWGAISFENCRYIKITGEGHPNYRYGFKLAAQKCGLAFTELSSDCEAGFIKIDHESFFGIMAKKDYGGNPPSPVPVFENLVIHDCFIENATEGMYLGETKSPGMEFRHVRVYNNIVKNTGRESIQIANMVEDVEIYNNTLLNAGQDEEDQQNNLLQIGDNSVAKVYNNIMMEAPGCGIISFGMGNNIYTNNFISSCKGIFLDNRKFTDETAPIVISDNYFKNNVDKGWIIRNMNQYNPLTIKDNIWDTEITFYKNDSWNSDNYVLENNSNETISGIVFTDPEQNNYALTAQNPEKYMNIGAPGGPEYYGIVAEDLEAQPLSVQIVLNKEMITDEGIGGSINSADLLVDEQSLTPDNDLHPFSKSWKPYWNMTKGPYHVYIDLKAMYNLTNISLHDMHNTKNLEISIGEPGNWEYLFTENCDKYINWKQHDFDASTQYIRLSMNESVFASVNEIVVYGYQEEQGKIEKSAPLANVLVSNEQQLAINENLFLIRNPVKNSLKLNLPVELAHNFKIEILSLNGSFVYSKIYAEHLSALLIIDISEECEKNGMYILRYSNQEGIIKTMKFLKRN